MRSDRRRERWSVTRGTPGDILAVLASLVRSRRGRGGIDRRWVRAGVLGLAGAGKAFPRLEGAWGMCGTGASSLSRGWQAAREQQQQQVRKVHTQTGIGIPAAVLPRRVVSSGSVGKGVIPALWRVLGRKMFL